MKKKKKNNKGTEIKITVKTVGQSRSVNTKMEQRAAHTPNRHRSHIVLKKERKEKKK